MPSNDYRFISISSRDITGADAVARVAIAPKRGIQSDAIDGDQAEIISITVSLTASERQTLQAVRDRACAKMDARRAAKLIDNSIEIDRPIEGETQ